MKKQNLFGTREYLAPSVDTVVFSAENGFAISYEADADENPSFYWDEDENNDYE